MTSDRVRVGQLGLGYWGPNLLRNLVALPDVQVALIADLDPRRLTEARQNGFAIESTTDYRRVLCSPEVDAVVIATPAATHGMLTEEALKAGKHVLVEKPLAMSSAECTRLIDLAAQQERVLMVGHTFLYNAAVRRLKEYLDEGELGQVLYLYSQRLNLGRVRQDVNALWNFAPHDVSIVLYLLGCEPTEVSARGFDYLQAGIEDVVFMMLVFPSDVAAHIHISWLDPQKVRRMTVVGNRKMIVYDDVSANAKLTLYDRGVDRVPTSQSPRDFKSFAEFQLLQRSGDVTIPAFKFPEPLHLECAHFVECIRTGQRPLTDGLHGLQVVKVLEAAQRSMTHAGAPEAVR